MEGADSLEGPQQKEDEGRFRRFYWRVVWGEGFEVSYLGFFRFFFRFFFIFFILADFDGFNGFWLSGSC